MNNNYNRKFNYTSRFSRLRNNIKTTNTIRNSSNENKRREFFKHNLKNFEEITKLVDILNDTYKRDSMTILNKLEEINKDKNSILEISNMDSTKIVLKYLIEKIDNFK